MPKRAWREPRRWIAVVGGATLPACCIASVLVVPAYAERLPVRTYTTADGLGSSAILAIRPDSRGFVWFATRNGLSRFDGSGFRSYTTDDGLANPVVRADAGPLTASRSHEDDLGHFDQLTASLKSLSATSSRLHITLEHRVVPVPEPSTAALLLAGLFGVKRLLRKGDVVGSQR